MKESNSERRSSVPTLEMCAGIHKAIQAEKLLFLPTKDETADYKRINLQMTLGDFINFQRLTMCFARDIGGNYDKTAPILKNCVSEIEWNKFYEEQVSANAELASIPAIIQVTSSITEKKDWFNLEGRQIDAKVSIKTAKSLIKTAITSMFEASLLGQQLPEGTNEKKEFEHVKSVEYYFENCVWILTQLNTQGVPINSEELSKYQERVNHLGLLIKQASSLLEEDKNII